MDTSGELLLTINTGSSSLKAALYEVGITPQRRLSFDVSCIGTQAARVRIVGGGAVSERGEPVSDHSGALAALMDWVGDEGYAPHLRGIGHRVVHGGPRYSEPQRVTSELIETLRRLIPIDPMHLPQAIGAIEAAQHAYPHIPQVACFDTAFHRQMPAVAQMYPLPGEIVGDTIIRYGFHGLSYEYILRALGQIDPQAAAGRIIIAHLGNGASMAAIRDGRDMDTTMGFSPTGGLVMGTRSGDLDPGVILYLMQGLGMTPAQVNDLLNKRSGLMGVSGKTSDMASLLSVGATDERAREAVDLFCYSARKHVGALAAVLGGLDTLIFTGGIGEHAGPVRAEICGDLGYLGLLVDPEENQRNAEIISSEESRVTVRVMKTDEDQMIALHTQRVLSIGG